MLKSYIKSAYRSIAANKLFSAIHITGLSIGLAACFIMLMIVIHEYSYDKHNEKLDGIYRVYSYSGISNRYSYNVPLPLSEYVKVNVPEAEKVARAYRINVNVSKVKESDEFEQEQACCIDSQLFGIITIKLVNGNSPDLLEDPNSIFISRKVAERYFPGKNPVGQYLDLKCRRPADENTFRIAGVFEDLPFTSSFKADYLLPMKYGEKLILKRNSWRKNFTKDSWIKIRHLDLYVLLNSSGYNNNSQRTILKYRDMDPDSQSGSEYRIQPYSEVHLNSKYSTFSAKYIDEGKVKFFSGIAFLILLIACLNFIVMSTSRIKLKAKDVGIRKVIGAAKHNVATNILIESVIYSIISLPITFGLVELLNKWIAGSLNVKLTEGYSSSFQLLLVFLVLTILIGLISGLYSTFKLIKLTPLQTISYKKTTGERKIKSTPAFLIAQMMVFIALIFCAIIVRQQTSYFKKGDLGFNPKNLLILSIIQFDSNLDSFKEGLKKSPLIKDVSSALFFPPTMSYATSTVPRTDDPQTMISLNELYVDYDYIRTLQMTIKKGREFDRDYTTDSTEALILNASAMKAINLKVDDLLEGKRIIGVVNDFKYGSMRNKIPPFALRIGTSEYYYELAIRFEPGKEYETIKYAEQIWNKFSPNQKLDYHFMDVNFDEVYKNEYNFAGLVNASAGLAVFIACLGLFGFTVFSTEQRIKEIGIRRILGASFTDILKLFFSQFVLLIVVSSVIGIALGDYFISQWLNGFAYKIEILPSYYIIAGVISVVIILTTISIYIIKTVSSNPVEALKYE